jgi:hypothetical protein
MVDFRPEIGKPVFEADTGKVTGKNARQYGGISMPAQTKANTFLSSSAKIQ